ncbi:hypothetical protein ISCGN_007746 [Ixodes scapularis]
MVEALRGNTHPEAGRIANTHKRRQKKPGILVAVDLKKAFDTVRHDAALGALKKAYPGTRILNVVKSFIKHRAFEIRSGNRTPQQFENNTGVLQGAILSPILFNVVMRELAQRLERGGQVRLTMYVDDITIWTEPSDHPTTERAREAIQWALDTIAERYTDASWNPENRRVALAETDLHHPPQTLHLRYETDLSVAELETLAVYHGIAAPRRATAAYDVKMLCEQLQGTRHIKTQVLWVPGHSGNQGNEAAHDLASEALPTARSTPPRLASPDRDQTPRPKSSDASWNGAESSEHKYHTMSIPYPRGSLEARRWSSTRPGRVPP